MLDTIPGLSTATIIVSVRRRFATGTGTGTGAASVRRRLLAYGERTGQKHSGQKNDAEVGFE